jgi:hypothetical protein
MVKKIAPWLSGSAGPGGVDSVDMQNWLLRFGKESLALQEEIAKWASWLAPLGGLLGRDGMPIDKSPGVRPAGIGELLQRLLAKIVLHTVRATATTACDNLNTCAGFEAGIEGLSMPFVMPGPAIWRSPPTQPMATTTVPLSFRARAITQLCPCPSPQPSLAAPKGS